LLRRLLEPLIVDVGECPNGLTTEGPVHHPKADLKAARRILDKLSKAEAPSDPAVNAPALEEALMTYSRGKVVALALPNWQRYARQGAQAGATVADAQTIGEWLYRQGWVQLGSQTLESVLRNWSSWLGKARAAGLGVGSRTVELKNGNLGQATGPQRGSAPGGRAAPGFGRKVPPTHKDGI